MNRRKLVAGLLSLAVVISACSSGSDSASSAAPGSTDAGSSDEVVAQVASYELVADSPQRFIVGLFSNEDGMVSFGSTELTFRYLGTEDEPLDEPRAGLTASAEFLPIPGSPVAGEPSARFTSPSEARGVYGADDISFDEAGFWEVTVDVEIDGSPRSATAAFEVGDTAHVPVVGDPAPRTENHLPGSPDAPPDAVDSRSDDDGTLPDPELHEETIAAALDAGRPVMVVVSTPVYCVSRFCGPITDTVQALARSHGDRMDFVHLEVWRDFENNAINKAAAEWIWPDRTGDPAEPWVFLVDSTGTIVQRWDNVATEADLADGVDQVLQEQP